MKRKEKEYLVCIIDTTAKYVGVKAKTKRGAENKINNGDWFDEDVQKEGYQSTENEVINDWNNLPKDVIKAPSINASKYRLDTMWDGIKYNTE